MTIEPRIAGLIQEEVDGSISKEGKAILSEFLASHPEAEAQLADFRALSALLAGAGRVDPPADLKAGILRAVRSAPNPVKNPLIQRLRDLWPGARVVLAYGYAVAAGLILGMAVIHWAPSGGNAPLGLDNPSELVGTMARPDGSSGGAALRQLPIQFQGGSGTATLRLSDAGYTVEFDVDSADPVRIVVGYDPGSLLFRGFAQDSKEIETLQAIGEKIAWTQKGHHRLTILMTPKTRAESSLEMEIIVSGSRVGGQKISLPAQG